MTRRDLVSQRALAISSFNEVGWEERRWCLCASKEPLLFLLWTISLPFVLYCVDQLLSLFWLSCLLPSLGSAGRNPGKQCLCIWQTLIRTRLWFLTFCLLISGCCEFWWTAGGNCFWDPWWGPCFQGPGRRPASALRHQDCCDFLHPSHWNPQVQT